MDIPPSTLNEDRYPEPLTPDYCQFKGYEFMPLHGHNLFTSKWYSKALKSPRAGMASFKLWWISWLQHPAASLPDDDDELALLADYGQDIKGWLKVKEIALHGFVLCRDGRLYHPFLAEKAIEAYEMGLDKDAKREKERERLRSWRKRGKSSNPSDAGQNGRNLPSDETRTETHDGTRFSQRTEVGWDTDEDAVLDDRTDTSSPHVSKRAVHYNTVQDSTVQEYESKSAREPDREADLSSFDEAWRYYPKREGWADAQQAWVAATFKERPAAIIAAIRAYAGAMRGQDERWIPQFHKWLNGERWKDDVPKKPRASAKPGGRGQQSKYAHLVTNRDDPFSGVTIELERGEYLS